MNKLTQAEIRRAVNGGGRTELRREECRDAAVLVPLLEIGDEWHLLFTKRTEDLEHHRGQVSFPGGSLDENESYEAAALRETFEEIGIPAQVVEIVGFLHDIWTPSRFVITPVVGIVQSLDRLEINPGEVSRVFTVPVSFFCNDDNAEIRNITLYGLERQVHFYKYDGETIWGATAIILRDLVKRLSMPASRRNGNT